MTKEEAIKFLQDDHDKLDAVITSLDEKQMTSIEIIPDWTVKDILGHISAWNIEEQKAVLNLLNNKKPWYVDRHEDDFNQKAIEKRKSWSLKKVITEWESTFRSLIETISSLTDEEWNHLTPFSWRDGAELTVASLFNYTYEGAGHEGGHSKQIKNNLKMKDKKILTFSTSIEI